MCWEARLRFVAGYRNMLGRGCADDCKDESLPVPLLRRCEAFGRGECRESLHQVPVHVPFSCWRHFIADVGKRKKLTWVATLESIHALVPRHFAGPHNAKTLGVLKMEALAPDARELVDSFLGRSLSQLNEAYMKHIVEIVQDFQHNPASYLQKKVVKMRVVDLYKVLSERLAEADKLYRKDDGVRVDTPVKDQPPEFAALFEAPWTPNLDPDDPANASTSTIYRMPNLPSRPSPEPEASTSTSAGTAAQDDQEPEAGPSGHTRSQRSSSEPGPPAQDDPIPAFPPGAEASPSGQPPIDYSGFPSPVQNWGVFAQPTPNSSGHTEPSPPAQEDPILSLSQEHAAPSRQAEPSSSSTPVPEYVTGASGLFPAPTPGPSLQQQTQLFNFELAAQNAPIQAFSQEPEPTPSGHAPGLFSQALSPAQYDINDIPGLLFAPPTPSPSGYTYTESSNLPPPAQDGQGPEPSSPGQPEPSSPVKNVRGPLLAPAPDISGHTPHAEPSNLEPLFPQDQEPDLTLSGHTEPSNPGSPLSPGSQAIVESVWAQFGLVSPGPDISGHTPHAEPSNSGPLFPQDQEPDLTLSAHTEPSTPASPLSPGSQAIVKSVWAQFGLVAGPDISGHTPHAEPSHSGSSPQDDQQPDPTSSGHAVHSSFGSPPAPYGQQPDPAPSGHAAPSALGGPLRPISGHSPDSPPSPESQAMLDSALGLYSTLAPAPDISGDAEPFE